MLNVNYKKIKILIKFCLKMQSRKKYSVKTIYSKREEETLKTIWHCTMHVINYYEKKDNIIRTSNKTKSLTLN